MGNKSSKNPKRGSRQRKNQKQKSSIIKFKIKPLAIALYADESPGSYLIYKMMNIKGQTVIRMMPRVALTNIGSVKRELLNHGYAFQVSNEAWKEIQEILSADIPGRASVVKVPGFHGHMFLLPNGTSIGVKNANKLILDPESNLHMPSIGASGSLKSWKTNVAPLAIHSSRIMLSLCAAFSAYMQRWAGVESGGFHLYGESSTGKSSCVFVAVSVQGSRECIESWHLSEAGLTGLTAGHCDQLLALDELKSLDANQKRAAELASKLVYQITSGQAKRLSTQYMSAVEQNALRWFVGILSTGELSLVEHAAAGEIVRMLGEEVRLVDVPADAGQGMGIYESLPDSKDTDTSAKLADKLNADTNKYYGVAGYHFLERFTRSLSKSESLVQERIQDLMKKFLDEHVDQSRGHQVRFAKRFALAYAGGVYAMKYDILPFSEAEIMQGISRCYRDALDARPDSLDDRISEGVARLEEALESSEFLDIRNEGHGYACDDLRSAWGFKAIVKGRNVRVLLPATFDGLIADDEVGRQILDHCKFEGRLLPDADGKNTRQVSSKLKGCRLPRGYCFVKRRS